MKPELAFSDTYGLCLCTNLGSPLGLAAVSHPDRRSEGSWSLASDRQILEGEEDEKEGCSANRYRVSQPKKAILSAADDCWLVRNIARPTVRSLWSFHRFTDFTVLC